MRIDKLLCFLRLAKTRSAAQTLVGSGHLRLNGKRVERVSQHVAVGDVLVLPVAHGVKVIELMTLPARRGPAPEAIACYRVLDGASENPIAAKENNSPQGTRLP